MEKEYVALDINEQVSSVVRQGQTIGYLQDYFNRILKYFPLRRAEVTNIANLQKTASTPLVFITFDEDGVVQKVRRILQAASPTEQIA